MERREPRRLRWAPARLGPAVGLAIGAAALVFAGGSWAVRSAREWVDGRPAYVHDFDDIALVPEPPRWIKPGRAGLLEGVRERSRLPERASVHDRDLAALDDAFRKRCPWVEKVGRVERSYPNRVTVRVERYCEPVARIPLGGRGAIVLDGRGVVLPEEEVDWAAAGPVFWVGGLPSPATADAQPGLPLKFSGPEDGEARPDRRVEDAARLAAFLKPRMRADPPPFQVDVIRPTAEKGLWLWMSGTFYVHWGEPPGAEPAGQPPAARKWDLLRAWLDGRRAAPPRSDQYAEFAGDRVELLDFRPRPAPGGSAAAVSHYQGRHDDAQGASTRR